MSIATAFPCPDLGEMGMSMRDFFAGLAMSGLVQGTAELACESIQCPVDTKDFVKSMADFSYSIADAMLEARK